MDHEIHLSEVVQISKNISTLLHCFEKEMAQGSREGTAEARSLVEEACKVMQGIVDRYGDGFDPSVMVSCVGSPPIPTASSEPISPDEQKDIDGYGLM